jgi:hypothetical protein
MKMFANCQHCRNLFSTSTMIRSSLADRGDRNAYVCTQCASKRLTASTVNNTVYGTPKKHGIMVAVDHEITVKTTTAQCELFHISYIMTDNGEGGTTFKSPLWWGLNAPVAQSESFQTMLKEKGIESEKDSDSLLYAGHIDYMGVDVADMVNTHYNELFGGLIQTMQEHHTNKTRSLLGKEKGLTKEDLERPIEMVYRDGKVMLGFRNVRFRNANQFDKLVHMAKDMTETITKNFLAHYNKASKDMNRKITQEDKRIHKARLTGEKLVEIFLEYIKD